ncbi:hypothetical protein GCM10010276_77160 [Streptomyces longisporus]|uniref:Uncharacterized protein n=1 Tax=Streptomyces longisporus TaxID=1948 RepID=A0ABN3N8K3_STRLO
MVASVARVRQLVVVMRSVKQTYRSDQEPAVHMADSRGQASAADGPPGPGAAGLLGRNKVAACLMP